MYRIWIAILRYWRQILKSVKFVYHRDAMSAFLPTYYRHERNTYTRLARNQSQDVSKKKPRAYVRNVCNRMSLYVENSSTYLLPRLTEAPTKGSGGFV